MEYRRLGHSGLEVSAVGLGTNNFGRRLDYDASAAVLRAALDQGITFIDTANTYSAGQSEEHIGRTLEGQRHRIVLATKGGGRMTEGPNGGGNSRKHLLDQVAESLRRLRTDYVDLYQVHFPDPNTPIEETVRALDDAVHQGKVRYVGVSNFSAWQACEAFWTCRSLGLAPVVSVQPEYSLLNREAERELVPFCRAYDLGIIPYYPLASGLLTGKYRAGEPPPEGTRLATRGPFYERWLSDRNFHVVGIAEAFAQERGHTVGELAITWLLAQPQVDTVIAGATKTWQVEANAKGADWHLTADDLRALDEALAPAI